MNGSGRLVAKRVWSCPVHEWDVSPDAEYGDPWSQEGEMCADCLTGTWRNERDADGALVMREMGLYEAFLADTAQNAIYQYRSVLLDALPTGETETVRIPLVVSA